MTKEQAALVAGYEDSCTHYGEPEWDLIREAEGAGPALELLAAAFRPRYMLGVPTP